jgi:D-glycero-alpha-D-manno-heptose-7-phosphate kinase
LVDTAFASEHLNHSPMAVPLPQPGETIVTRAPTRIDFGGGWTDVPPYADELGGFVCNIAITRYATATLTRGANRAVDTESRSADRSIGEAAARRFGMSEATISVHSDFPIGAGLGGSSAAGVAAVGALAISRGEPMDRSALAELSRDIEIADLGIAGGRQDHYAAAYGGALGLRFSAGHVDIRPIPLDRRLRADIERRCIVVYTGQSRISGDTIEAVMNGYRRGDAALLAGLARMRQLAESMVDALGAGDLDQLASLVSEQWTHQRALHPAIPTPLIDEIIATGHAAGSIGAKALGASGGGCVLLIAAEDRVDEVRAAVAPLGALLPFTVAEHGMERCR